MTYHSSLSSAEWIQERPLVNQTFSDLSGFTPVTFTGATAVQNGQRISLAQTNPQMLNLLDVPTNTALAVPSPVATNGMNFTVFRTSAVSTPGATSSATIIPPAPSIDAQIPPFELHRTGWDILRIYF
ncbi:MAG: hypothetical protein JWM92_151 [Candidatus Nomurabacteria bacterium]|nr:hypothetical protein [Candidatus Nomurabacteria bacterium]